MTPSRQRRRAEASVRHSGSTQAAHSDAATNQRQVNAINKPKRAPIILGKLVAQKPMLFAGGEPMGPLQCSVSVVCTVESLRNLRLPLRRCACAVNDEASHRRSFVVLAAVWAQSRLTSECDYTTTMVATGVTFMVLAYVTLVMCNQNQN